MIKVNDNTVDVKLFLNKESFIPCTLIDNILKKEPGVDIQFKFESNEDLLNLFFILGHADTYRQEEDNDWKKIRLTLLYMPYSTMEENSCNMLLSICRLLSTFLTDTDDVFIVEPHSDNVIQLLLNEIHPYCVTQENVYKIDVLTSLTKYILSKEEIDIICVDENSKERFKIDTDKQIIHFQNKELITNTNLANKNILIINDIYNIKLDNIVTELKDKGANNIYLSVCHCGKDIEKSRIYSDGGLINPDTPMKHIYGMNTMLSDDSFVLKFGKNITVYDIEQFLKNNIFKSKGENDANTIC